MVCSFIHSLESKLSANVKPTSLLVAPVILSYAKGPPSSAQWSFNPSRSPRFRGAETPEHLWSARKAQSATAHAKEAPSKSPPKRGDFIIFSQYVNIDHTLRMFSLCVSSEGASWLFA